MNSFRIASEGGSTRTLRARNHAAASTRLPTVQKSRSTPARRTAEVFQQLAIAQRQAKAAQDSVEAIKNQMRQDQRAWVGVQVMNGRVDLQSDGLFRLQVEILLKNTGKTPALRMGGETILLDRSRTDPIPEFDREATASVKELKERLQTMLKRTPEKSFRESIAAELQNIGARMVIPKGDVLAPEATRAVMLTPNIFLIPDPAQRKPAPRVTYILGKFTYSDIFQSKQHSTKICVMWRGGETLPQICPESNWMD